MNEEWCFENPENMIPTERAKCHYLRSLSELLNYHLIYPSSNCTPGWGACLLYVHGSI